VVRDAHKAPGELAREETRAPVRERSVKHAGCTRSNVCALTVANKGAAAEGVRTHDRNCSAFLEGQQPALVLQREHTKHMRDPLVHTAGVARTSTVPHHRK
jgi:hypothetical protein